MEDVTPLFLVVVVLLVVLLLVVVVVEVLVVVVVVHIVVQPMQHIVFVTPMTVYKNVPSSPNVGPSAVAPSARNKKQNNNSNETQNRFRVHSLKDFQRLSEKCDVY